MGPRRRNRDAQASRKVPELLYRSRQPHSRASKNHGTLCLGDSRQHFPALFSDFNAVPLECVLCRVVAFQTIRLDLRSLYVNRYVDPAGALASVGCEIERSLKVIAN